MIKVMNAPFEKGTISEHYSNDTAGDGAQKNGDRNICFGNRGPKFIRTVITKYSSVQPISFSGSRSMTVLCHITGG